MGDGPEALRPVQGTAGLPADLTAAALAAVPTSQALPVGHERRRYRAAHRQSWADPQPFVLSSAGTRPQQPGATEPMQRALTRRAAWMRPLLARAVVGDVVAAAGVAALLTASLPRHRADAWLAGTVAALIWVAAIGLTRGYEAGRMGDGAEEFQAITRAAVGVVLAISLFSYSFQILLPRREVLVAVPLTGLLSAMLRHALRQRLHARRHQGQAMLRTLLVGEPASMQRVVADLRRQTSHGFSVVGVCVPAPGPEIEEQLGVDILGSTSELPQVVVDHDVDSVIVVGAQLAGPALRRLSWALERTGAQLLVEPGLVEVAGPNVSLRPAAGLSLLHLETPSSRAGRLVGKTVLDRVVGTALLAAAIPVIACSAIAVRLTSRGPAFFKQTRMGLDGSTFTMYKLRSMVVDAETRRTELLADSSRDGLMFKMKQDPRITRVGAFLRRFSLDELPQLLNVVRGDMSLVGPRPPLVSEYEQYHDDVHRRLRVRPGLTGLWQVSGRADLTWEESVRLDLRYVDNWSLALDLLILWKTARAVLGRSGAY